MDRREALEKAFDEHVEDDSSEEGLEEEVVAGDELEPEETEETPEEGATDDEPAKVQKEEAAPDTKGEGQAGKADTEYSRAAKAATGKAPVAPGAGSGDDKAPLAWKPAVREHWGKLPPEVRQEVARRELEVQQALSQSSNSRKFASDFGQVIQPFTHLIQATNSTPLQAVRNLMTTAAGLTIGTHEQKAKIVAEIIKNYGVDVQTLDAVLSNATQMPNPPANGGGMSPQLMQMLKPMQEFMGEVKGMREQRQQKIQQEADAETAQFATKPFFEDLRGDMADLMEIAANRGTTMTMQQAYDKAVALNPDIGKIISQRRQAEDAKRNGGTRLARARRASSTLNGVPASSADSSKTIKNRRDAIEAAWDNAESR